MSGASPVQPTLRSPPKAWLLMASMCDTRGWPARQRRGLPAYAWSKRSPTGITPGTSACPDSEDPIAGLVITIAEA